MLSAELAKRHRVDDGTDFRIDRIDPADTGGFDIEKAEARELLEDNVKRMRKLQDRLHAENKWSILIVLQSTDTGGKDSAIEHVMSGINPQGCDVTAFKAPSETELRHDFLWRHAIALPRRGRIGIFNRSHYEEVLVVRVHPEILAKQNLPEEPAIWTRRFASIRNFEEHLTNNGTVVLKFFLHISKDEQARRILARIDDPDKNWKFSASDLAERERWDEYRDAFEDMVRNTARPYAPWFVVPSNDKWYSRLVIASAVTEALETLNPQYPEVSAETLAMMADARASLQAEAGYGKGEASGKEEKNGKNEKNGKDEKKDKKDKKK